jgi:hypothetical protein
MFPSGLLLKMTLAISMWDTINPFTLYYWTDTMLLFFVYLPALLAASSNLLRHDISNCSP